jgi:hypothetical protein
MSWSIIIYDVTKLNLCLFYLRAAQDWSEVMAFRKSPSEVSIKASTASGSIESDSYLSLKIKIKNLNNLIFFNVSSNSFTFKTTNTVIG